jgi:hypothetical protein
MACIHAGFSLLFFQSGIGLFAQTIPNISHKSDRTTQGTKAVTLADFFVTILVVAFAGR